MAQGSARASVPSSSYSEEHEQNEHAWHLQYGQWCSLWSAEQKAWQSANIRSPSRPELQRPVIAAWLLWLNCAPPAICASVAS